MKDKLTYSSQQLSDISLVGGKGHHLQKLVHWKANVAPFFVIGTGASSDVSPETRKEIETFIKLHKKIVFRSSMIGEDHLDASFAGIFETVLCVDENNWEQSLTKVYDSLNSPRVKSYISQKNLNVDLRMAVVVQKEIQVQKSGVLFTRAPILPTSAVAIDAALGMGDGVVSGHVDVDHYLVTRLGEIVVGEHNTVLTQAEILKLLKTSLELESKFGHASDIEWGFVDDELFIFQIRAITQEFKPLKVFADTNLSESYPGTISPFSASFVQKAYENVFLEAAQILGYEGKRLKVLKIHCADLIAPIDDHLYYHLEHYYAVLRALPGGEKNIANWHKMIGGKVDGIEVPFHDTKLSSFELTLSILKIFKLSFNNRRIHPRFLTDLDALAKSINQDMDGLKNAEATIVYLNQLMNRPLGFGLTIVNDFFIMIGLGLLSYRFKHKGIHEDAVMNLLKTSQSVDSVKPLEAFDQLVEQLSDGFLSAFNQIPTPSGFSPYDDAFAKLTPLYPQDVAVLIKFLADYGDRSFEELKLESLPLKNDPELLKRLITWGKNNKSTAHLRPQSNSPTDLNFIDHKILNFTRECIEFRETTRLWRGRFYHFLRQLVIKLGSQIVVEHEGFENYHLRDFFSLTHHEWLRFARKDLSVAEVKRLMDARQWQKKNKSYPEFLCWTEDESLPAINRTVVQSAYLKGQGVSPGIIEGLALVLENPTEILESELKQFILVTKNTDPAWVYIMSRSQGLISEKGSMLSHTAIIGRELGIPTLVGVKLATQQIKTGDRIRIDGTTGEVRIL